MTEQKEPSAMTEEANSAAENNAQPVQPESKPVKTRSNAAGITLSIVAIAIALAAGAGLYSWGKHQAASQMAQNESLSAQLNALQQLQSQQKIELENLIKQQTARLEEARAHQVQMAKALAETQQKVAAISGSDAKVWQLAQSDFLVKLAGRKLWSDQDVTTAIALLRSADESLAQMNDPRLINARRALTQDISSLSGVTQIDFDGIILKLNQLSNQVDNLRLADNDDDDSPMDSNSKELSGSLTEWRQNLVKSWHNFMENFITIRRRDTTDVPLLAPNQDIYLRENIRSRLLIAVQAVPRHQDETYKQSLETVSTWIRAYYDTDDAATKGFLADLDTLSQQSIEMDVPDTLASQPILEKLMRAWDRHAPMPASDAASGAQPQQGE